MDLRIKFIVYYLDYYKKEEKMEKIKSKITIENALCLFIIICPILDMASFLFRNALNTNFSPSTFIRPVISIVVAIIIFVKCNFKR